MLIAHAFGARYDLPVPLWMFLVGSGLEVLASFALVARREIREADLLGVDGEVSVRIAPIGRWSASVQRRKDPKPAVSK